MKDKKYILISLLLMTLSGILLFLASIYYDLADKMKDYHYSDAKEYDDITQGLDFLDKLPIHFNIMNQYFSNMNHLDQKKKEEIVMAWVIKNHYQLYECGPSSNVAQYLCIDKEDLNAKDLLRKFNLDLNFTSNEIKIYIDDYGTYNVTSSKRSKAYKIILDPDDNKNFRIYSKFSHYKQEKEKYIFYLYQGYYQGNCIKNEPLHLYDFMTGKKVYSNTCNGGQNFTIDPKEKAKKLQLYKYELKKDKDQRFYLYGYNPVNKIES